MRGRARWSVVRECCPNRRPVDLTLASAVPQRPLNCKKRTCPHCGNHWAGDVRVMLLENLNRGYGAPVDMVTITAPGRELLPHEPGEGGEVLPEAAEWWNRSAPGRWSAMWAASKYLLRRRGVELPWLLAYVIAYQRRGVIHYHLALAADTPGRKAANRWFVALMKGEAAAVLMFKARPGTLERRTVASDGLAAEFGFGFVSLEVARYGSAGVAGYFCKYVSKGGASGRAEITETVQRVEVGRRRVVYVGARLTARTRCTMRNLRLRRYYWHAEGLRGLRDCRAIEDMHRRGLYVSGGRLWRPVPVLTEAVQRGAP